MPETKMNTNRLIEEKSPYLLQHSHNPVDWYPWGEEAIDRAANEDKPILLSIGYSTCHWCHVMAHESFEDPEVAELINAVFVPVKVDREERPDIDHVYMKACQLMTGVGGWPLTILLTPQKIPFFAATYIPKQGQFPRSGLMELVPKIDKLWKEQKESVLQTAQNINDHLQRIEKDTSGELPGPELLDKAFSQLSERFDRVYGGFGRAPKFPSPHNLYFLLLYWKKTSESSALEMVEETLLSMRRGGIFDHVGLGFHRYSTDKFWLLPHFEKMLYDQALLALSYLKSFEITQSKIYADTAGEIFSYVLRDLQSPEGPFYCGEDADSEGVEGKFYVWTEQEIKNNLSPEEAQLVMDIFGVKSEGNFREEATGSVTGQNVLHLAQTFESYATEKGLDEAKLQDIINKALEKLYKVREKRIRPLLDDKILTDWNGLMIAALARGGRVTDKQMYTTAAQKAADFILNKVKDDQEQLMHRYKEGEAAIPAFLDDYAFMVWGLIELYTAVEDEKYLKEAVNLTRKMLELFWDQNRGGLFFTSEHGEKLIIRDKEIFDGAIPSGNSAALTNLVHLASLYEDKQFESSAVQLVKSFSKTLQDSPSVFTHFMCGLSELFDLQQI